MAVKRSFSSAIVYSRRLPKGKVDLMVLFMMDNHCDLFKVSATHLLCVCERVETRHNQRPAKDLRHREGKTLLTQDVQKKAGNQSDVRYL